MPRIAGLVLAVLLVAPAVAQDIVEAVPPESFREHFDLNADVSGARLVGLRLGSAEAPNAGPLYLQLVSPATEVCIRAISQDGRYSATNPFGVPGATSNAVVRIPAISQHYVKELSQFAPGSVAARAYVAAGADCNPADALNLPLSSSAQPDATLVALVNGRVFSSRMELATDDGAVIGSADCIQAGDAARIAYDMACSLALPPGAERGANLRLVFNDGFADEVHDYRIALPAVAAP